MGLVTSFINQIGREIGRDTYRSLVSKKLKNNDDFFSPFTDNSIYDEVIHFELRATEDETFRRLANLVERAEHADPEDFDWQELFYEIDNKIEFCKTHLSSEYAPKLDQLDTINAANYHKIKSLHVNYIDSLINQFESKLNEENTIGTGQIIVRSLIGLRTKNSKNRRIRSSSSIKISNCCRISTLMRQGRRYKARSVFLKFIASSQRQQAKKIA